MSGEKDRDIPAANKPPIETQISWRMRLNTEEMRVLQECNRESFYYRSLPLAIAAMTATHLAVRRGLLRPHPRWGSALKVVGAGFVSWVIGKVSYRSTCEEKFLQLQNSQLADLIRKKRGYALETHNKESSSGDEIMLHADNTPTYSFIDDYTSSSRSLNLDTDKNIQYSGLDDSDRPTGSEYDTQLEDRTPKYSTTYDDLRRKNREEYELRQSKLYQSPSISSSVPPSSSTSRGWSSFEDKPANRQSSYRPGGSGGENVYGDRWDK